MLKPIGLSLAKNTKNFYRGFLAEATAKFRESRVVPVNSPNKKRMLKECLGLGYLQNYLCSPLSEVMAILQRWRDLDLTS